MPAKAPESQEQLVVEETPSVPPPPVAGPWRSYKELVGQLAARIVEAQRPIRVLQSIRWDNGIEEQFVKSKYKDMPRIDSVYREFFAAPYPNRSSMGVSGLVVPGMKIEIVAYAAIS